MRMQVIKPIRTEADYDAAVAEIEKLWDEPPGTPNGDRRDVLFTLIEAYEAEHHAIELPDPIDAIKFWMDQQGLSQQALADTPSL